MKRSYEDKVHLIGRISLLIGLIGTFLLPLTLWFRFGIIPPASGLIKGFLTISMFMLPVAFTQILSFAPILGSSALYMSYLTGNLSNLKIPSAAVAMEAAGTDPNSEEGDVLSTVAVAGSVIISEIIILLGVIAMAPLSGVMHNPIVQSAFAQILPSLFGALFISFALKSWKLSIAPLLVSYCLAKLNLLPTALILPISILISILTARLFYKKGWLEKENLVEQKN